MEEKLLNDLKPLFIYTKKVGECAITAEMELNRVTNISKHISKIDKEGKTIPAIPMIGMFKGTIKQILEMYGEEMIRHLDDNNDEDDYHSPLITIYPNQKISVQYYVTADIADLTGIRTAAQTEVNNRCGCASTDECNLSPVEAEVNGELKVVNFECTYTHLGAICLCRQINVPHHFRQYLHKYPASPIFWKYIAI